MESNKVKEIVIDYKIRKFVQREHVKPVLENLKNDIKGNSFEEEILKEISSIKTRPTLDRCYGFFKKWAEKVSGDAFEKFGEEISKIK